MHSYLRRIGVGLAVVLLTAPVFAAPVPAANAKYELPTIVIQAQSGQKLLDDLRKFVKLNGGTPEMLAKVAEMQKQFLGEKGFAGLDLTKPLGGYAYLRAKADTSSLVLVLPITNEKDALGFVERLKIEAKEVSKPKGVYELVGGPFDDGLPGHLRLHDKHAYISINGGIDSLAELDKLVPISRLVDEKETAVLAVTLTGKRMPKELTDQAYQVFDEANQGVDRLLVRAPADMPKNLPPFLKEMLGWGRRCYDLMIADGDTLGFRVSFDDKTGDLDTETILTPNAKSVLAADLAEFKPGRGRFHQLATKDSVAGGWLVLPGPIPTGVRSTFGAFVGESLPMLGKHSNLPAEMLPLFDSLATIGQKAFTDGEVDLGLAMASPNKDGHYTAVAALGLDDPTPLVKLVLAIAKDLPKEFAEAIKLNAYKIGDVPVHTFALAKLIPEDLLKIFGEKPALNIAVGNKGLFLAVGPGAEAELKRAMALKPAEARAFDMVVNLAKGKELVKAGGGNLRELEQFPVPDRVISFYSIDVRGGKDFRTRGSSGQLTFMMLMGLAGMR